MIQREWLILTGTDSRPARGYQFKAMPCHGTLQLQDTDRQTHIGLGHVLSGFEGIDSWYTPHQQRPRFDVTWS